MNTATNLEVECLGLAHGGAMICQVISGESTQIGKKAFVAGLIPGERAEVSILEDKKSFLNATLIQITKVSEKRITPPCPVFAECGGCDLQYLGIAEQRELKRQMFEQTLIRQSKLSLPNPVKLLGENLPAYGYRKRIALHLSQEGELGFYRPQSGEVVPISRCLIASDLINQALTALLKIVEAIAPFIAGISIEEFASLAVPIFKLRESVSRDEKKRISAELQKAFKLGKLYDRDNLVSDWHLNLSELEIAEFKTLNHFSQINEQGNDILIEKVKAHLADQDAVTEFYAGSGNFSFPLALEGKKLNAIELDRNLVALGRERAKTLELSNLNFTESSVEKYLHSKNAQFFPSVLLDPPRSGAAALCKVLESDKVRKIVYVSCALPTLSRDLVTLVARGFKITEIAIIDMFAQTHHVESVVALEA